jgi:hypothetical protein
MSAIRIRKKLHSETLYVPELRPYIGQMVEIAVEESAANEEARAAQMKEVLDHIAANRITTLAPGTPDSTEMLREDRAR